MWPRRSAFRLASLLALVVGAACLVEREVDPGSTSEVSPPGEAPAASAEDPERRMERHVFDLVNRERRERGLHELEWDDQLAQLARSWSQQMAEKAELQHQDAERMLQRSEGFTAVGENIFRATGAAPASTIHVGWMRSDLHRANLLRETFDRIGVGVVCTEKGEVWATQRFGRTTGSDLPRRDDSQPPEQPIVAEPGKGPRCPGSVGSAELQVDPR